MDLNETYINPNENGYRHYMNNANFKDLQKVRQDLIGELDAVLQYDEHIESSNNESAKATWINIRDEELVHIGELLGLMFYLAPYQKQFVEKGIEEFTERRKNM